MTPDLLMFLLTTLVQSNGDSGGVAAKRTSTTVEVDGSNFWATTTDGSADAITSLFFNRL